MHGENNPIFKDGFRADEDDPEAPYLIFAERLGGSKGVFYLHGALHLYVSAGNLKKHSWIRTGKRLTDLIQASLERGEYPLFIAEGTSDKKLEQIQRNGYLWYCLDKFARIEGPLVVLGHSIGPPDQHIADKVAENPKLENLYIGLFGDPEWENNQAIIRCAAAMQANRQRLQDRFGKRYKNLEVAFFDSESANVWG